MHVPRWSLFHNNNNTNNNMVNVTARWWLLLNAIQCLILIQSGKIIAKICELQSQVLPWWASEMQIWKILMPAEFPYNSELWLSSREVWILLCFYMIDSYFQKLKLIHSPHTSCTRWRKSDLSWPPTWLVLLFTPVGGEHTLRNVIDKNLIKDYLL